MSRMILFRGKRKDNGEWVYGDLLNHPNGLDKRIIYLEQIGNNEELVDEIEHNIEVLPESVGQFTGISDKNGAKIFESDILSCNGFNYRVEFMNGSWVVVPNRKTKGIEFLYYCLQDSEIIGNIHDNPNLIPQPLN